MRFLARNASKVLVVILFTLMVSAWNGVHAEPAERRANIVWIVVEDMSAHFGCYGETSIRTPAVDRLAEQGIRFTDAVVTAPVCSASRSALITGMYQTSIGAHHHRSGRGKLKIHLPEKVRPVPMLFQQAGYQTLNLTFSDFMRSAEAATDQPGAGVAKTDYNFEWDASMYDRVHWTRRKSGQPFFVQIQLRGGKRRGHGDDPRWPATVEEKLGATTPADAVRLPPYLPDDPVIREDWRQYLDCVRYVDWQLGQILERLAEADEIRHTCVFFTTDHGISHVRNKQFLYEGGIHVPLIVTGPGIKPGTVRTDPIEHIDIAATSLALADIAIPEWMQARDILAADYQPRQYVFSARDRCDETVDHIRCARGTRYKYIRNFLPERPYLQPNAYKDAKPIVQAMRRLHREGRLSAGQRLILADRRGPEELYDLRDDPYELNNLAGDSDHEAVLARLRAELKDWMVKTGDQGRTPESAERYESEMTARLKDNRRRPERLKIIRENIEWMKRQARSERAKDR